MMKFFSPVLIVLFLAFIFQHVHGGEPSEDDLKEAIEKINKEKKSYESNCNLYNPREWKNRCHTVCSQYGICNKRPKKLKGGKRRRCCKLLLKQFPCMLRRPDTGFHVRRKCKK